jgi:hypothetical protein
VACLKDGKRGSPSTELTAFARLGLVSSLAKVFPQGGIDEGGRVLGGTLKSELATFARLAHRAVWLKESECWEERCAKLVTFARLGSVRNPGWS